jgi:hypothetical protein
MPLLTASAKKWGLSPRTATLTMSIIIGAAYVAFQQYFPTSLKTEVIQFTTQVFTIGWVVYNFLIKDNK